MENTRVFVSHSHQDNAFGTRLVTDLRRLFHGEDAVWYDSAGGLHGGDSWWLQILHEVESRPIFLVILSPDSMQSPWVSDEITMAWRQRNSPEGKRIIPVLYRTCQIRRDLSILQYVSFLSPRPYDEALDELLATIRGAGQDGPQPIPPISPEPGGTKGRTNRTPSTDESTVIAGSSKGERYQNFHRLLARELRERGLDYTPSTIDQANYCEFYAGFEGALYVTAFTGNKEVRTALVISRHDNKRLFDALYQHRMEIESSFGQPLTWERNDHQIGSRIAAYYPGGGSIFDDDNKLNTIRTWLCEKTLRLQKSLTPWLNQMSRLPYRRS